jgi:hypothetical protein
MVAGLEAVLTALALGTILRLRPDLVRAVRPRRAALGAAGAADPAATDAARERAA